MAASADGARVSIVLRRLAYGLLEVPLVVRALRANRGPSCAIILLHRFQDGLSDSRRHDPRQLRQLLGGLRKAGVAFVSLDQALNYCSPTAVNMPPLAVCFTVDDGYADFGRVAWPIFKEFGCPASLFVVPTMVEQRDWFWWDKVDFILRVARKPRVSITLGEKRLDLRWHDEHSRVATFETMVSELKNVPTGECLGGIRELAAFLGVALPNSAPSCYEVLDWTSLRALERDGVTIGPHSMTHPVLSRCSHEQVREEIVGSIHSLRNHLVRPLSVFCFPNGMPEDHGPREWTLLAESEVPYALSTSPGLLRPQIQHTGGAHWAHRLPRIGFDEQAGRIVRELLT